MSGHRFSKKTGKQSHEPKPVAEKTKAKGMSLPLNMPIQPSSPLIHKGRRRATFKLHFNATVQGRKLRGRGNCNYQSESAS